MCPFVSQILWSVDILNNRQLIGQDEFGEDLIRVSTGSSHWIFSFSGYEGQGKVRVGAGCNYNPLVLIEDIFQKIQHGLEIPVELDRMDFDNNRFSEDWR